MRQQTFTPKELARAVAASESSIKRWIDQGLLRASKTAGGHRRVALADAFRFIRETGQTLVDPSALGLATPADAVDFSDPESVRREYLKALETGDERMTASLVSHLHLLDVRIADILDTPVLWAFRDIRNRCDHPSAECVVLHRGFANSIRAAGRLRELEEAAAPAARRVERGESRDERTDSSRDSGLSALDRPRALLADVGYEIDGLPTHLAETVFASLGVRCTQLGTNVPDEVLHGAIGRVKPTFLWLSAGGAHKIDRSAVRRTTNETLRLAAKYHARVLLAGDAVPKRQDLAGVAGDFGPTYLGSMAELSAFAAGVLGEVASPA